MKISIVTVCYNSEKTIKDTFDSIRNQNYHNIEYIVIDGQSNDDTINIIKENSDIISKIIIESDNGIYDAMNKGIQHSTGEVIGILNSDDIYKDTETIKLLATEFQDKTVDIVYGNIQYVSQDLSSIVRKWQSSNFVKGSFKKGWHPAHPAFFVRRKVYENIGEYDLKFDVSADFDLMFRAMEIFNFKSKFINRVITNMRIGGTSNKSLKNVIRGNKQILQSFKKNQIPLNPIVFVIRRLLPKLIQFFH